MKYLWVHCLSKFWLNLTETSSLNQSLVCQAKCVCDSQIGVLGATKRDSCCRRRGRCLLVWKASPGFFRHHESSSDITSLLQAQEKQNSFWLVIEKKSSGVRKSRQGREKKKWHPGSLEAEKKLNGMCKANCTRSSGVGKKSKKAIHRIETSEEKAVEKKRNDFESTDADRITCKGTHYFMGA